MNYRQYLKSDTWRQKAKQTVKQAGYKCALCSGVIGLQVHHRTYKRLGRELPEDLIVLCRACHERHHQIKSEEDMYDRP